jgi:hypothetical protein
LLLLLVFAILVHIVLFLLELSFFDFMQVLAVAGLGFLVNFFGPSFFSFLGLVDVVDRVFLLQVASFICSLEVLVRGCLGGCTFH